MKVQLISFERESKQGEGPKINESPFWFILRVLEALILKYLPFKYFGPKIKRECCGALQSWDKNVFICIFLTILSWFCSNLAQNSLKTVEMSRFDLTLKSCTTFPFNFWPKIFEWQIVQDWNFQNSKYEPKRAFIDFWAISLNSKLFKFPIFFLSKSQNFDFGLISRQNGINFGTFC